MRIIWIVQHLGKGALQAGVIDDAGRGRKINYRWFKKEDADIPPPTWVSDLQSELNRSDPDEPPDPFGFPQR